MHLTAITTIAGLEVRQRIRSTRWKITVTVLFLLISAIVFGSLFLVVGYGGDRYGFWAENLLDIILGIVLFLGLAAAPTLSATSINGDRRDGTLALIQATPISSWDLVVGKLLGSWLSALALIGVAFPYLVWGIASSYASIGFGILAVLILALMMLAYCALGLGFSALTVRPAASAMLTQSTVLLLLVGLPIVFGLTYPATVRTNSVVVRTYDGSYWDSSDDSGCTLAEESRRFVHTEYTWWLLAPNPLLIVSDTLSAGIDSAHSGEGPGASSALAYAQSAARSGPYLGPARCGVDYSVTEATENRHYAQNVGRSWYLGLAFTVLLGGWSLWIASRRLRIPAGKLPAGVRIA